MLPDLGQKLARHERLRDIGVAAGLECLHVVAAQSVRGHHDDGNVPERGVPLDPPGGLVAVEARKLYVHEDQVRPLLFRLRHAVLARDGLDHLDTCAAQEQAHDASVLLVILDDQHALAHALPACRSIRSGTVKENVDPWPSTDSTQRRPPWSSTMRREMDSPSPLPPFARVLELSACWNSSKIFSWSASEIPGPVSVTDTTKFPSDIRASMDTLPASVNLIALPARFRSTWVSRRSSPRPGGRPGGTVASKPSFFPAASDSTAETTAWTTSPMA